MTSKARNLVLTKSQAACLIALRRRKDSKPEIAIQAKLDLTRTATELGALARIGLASQNQSKRWHTTTSGKACRFKIVPDRPRRNSGLPGPGAQRLLQLLDRPMRGSEIAEELGLSHQRVRQLVIKLHAQGRVSFGDPDKPFWIVMRAGDKNSLAVARRGACPISNPARVCDGCYKDTARGAYARAHGAANPQAFGCQQICPNVRGIEGQPSLSDHRRRIETSSTR